MVLGQQWGWEPKRGCPGGTGGSDFQRPLLPGVLMLQGLREASVACSPWKPRGWPVTVPSALTVLHAEKVWGASRRAPGGASRPRGQQRGANVVGPQVPVPRRCDATLWDQPVSSGTPSQLCQCLPRQEWDGRLPPGPRLLLAYGPLFPSHGARPPWALPAPGLTSVDGGWAGSRAQGVRWTWTPVHICCIFIALLPHCNLFHKNAAKLSLLLSPAEGPV